MKQASCLCGAVTIKASGAPESVTACHCVECRKQSGHFWAGAFYRKPQVIIEGLDFLRWYCVSKDGRRGFCRTCGSFLVWESRTDDLLVLAAGAFDDPLGVSLKHHIFAREKGDYYVLGDTTPVFEEWGDA